MKLVEINGYTKPTGPVVLAIMDGVGIGVHEEGDAVKTASTPTLDWLKENGLYTELRAHGGAVGMPTESDMGNSEVGHNAIGCGRVFEQGATLVKAAFENRSIFASKTWQTALTNINDHSSTLHFVGLLSDGNVHSHLSHLLAMLSEASDSGIERVRCHILLDGRDVGGTSALDYVNALEDHLASINEGQGRDYRIASGGGRMRITMDRYNADWSMVDRGWAVHVHGVGPQFESATAAIKACRAEKEHIIDQDLSEFVVTDGGKAVGTIEDGDSVIMVNFRGDRAMELTKAFEDDDFDYFDRGRRPTVFYAGMLQYDADLEIPKHYLVSPPQIDRTMGEYMANTKLSTLAISETQKYGHVTYFFNGNKTGKFSEDLETYVEIPSDNLPFEQRPWMKGAEITDVVIDAIESNSHNFLRINYPNGDMVGHTGNLLAVEISVEAVDLCIARLLPVLKAAGGILVLTADHGNADDMYEHEKDGTVKVDAETGRKKMKTSHSLNPVPCYVYDPAGLSGATLGDTHNLGITSLTATCINLLGYTAPEGYDPSIVNVKNR